MWLYIFKFRKSEWGDTMNTDSCRVKIRLKDINPCALSSEGPFSLECLLAERASGLLNVGALMLKYCICFEDFPRYIDFSKSGLSCELLDALDNFSHQIQEGNPLLNTAAENPDEANQAKFNYLLMLLSNGCLTSTCINTKCHR